MFVWEEYVSGVYGELLLLSSCSCPTVSVCWWLLFAEACYNGIVYVVLFCVSSCFITVLCSDAWNIACKVWRYDLL